MSVEINEITLGQLKELMRFASPLADGDSVGLPSMVGKKVLVRSRCEGVNFGEVMAHDETGVVLRNARRLWYYKPIDEEESWYEGVANSGLHTDSRISVAASMKVIIEDYSMTLCSEKAIQSIQAAVPHAQS